MRDDIALAIACIVEALATSIDPSGAIIQRTRGSLREGLEIAEAFGAPENETGAFIGGFLEALEKVESGSASR